MRTRPPSYRSETPPHRCPSRRPSASIVAQRNNPRHSPDPTGREGSSRVRGASSVPALRPRCLPHAYPRLEPFRTAPIEEGGLRTWTGCGDAAVDCGRRCDRVLPLHRGAVADSAVDAGWRCGPGVRERDRSPVSGEAVSVSPRGAAPRVSTHKGHGAFGGIRGNADAANRSAWSRTGRPVGPYGASEFGVVSSRRSSASG